MIRKAQGLLNSGAGQLQLWHFERHLPYQGVPYEDRTHGDLLDEWYTAIALRVDQLRSRRAELGADGLDRLASLEEILQPRADERVSLRNLSPEEAESVYMTAHKTGDPLGDYWEYRISKGLEVDLDLKSPPPRSQWDHA